MSDLAVTVTGLKEAQSELEFLGKSFAKMEGMKILVGSRRPYAYGIEEGVHEVSGTVARHAGGVHMLAGAADRMLAGADGDITTGMKITRAPGPWVLKRLALWVRRLARAGTPRLTGTLKKSIRMFTIRGL